MTHPPPPDPDDVVLAPYDAAWPGSFDAMAQAFRDRFGEIVGRVEHVGSTAVPGMAAKPIIDMLVAITSFEQARRRIVPALVEEGWAYWWRDDRPPGHMMLVRRDPATRRRTHHVHMAPLAQASLWQRVAFRDYLIAHPAEAQRYARLKQDLATRMGHDREAYTEAKGEYVHQATQRALQWQTRRGEHARDP